MEKFIDGIEYVILGDNMGGVSAAVQDLIVSQRSRKSNITIPSHVEGIPVLSILQNAFQDASWIETVNIPKTITSIGAGAFDNCKKLKRVTIDGNDRKVYIYRNAFSRCYSLESIEMLGNGVLCLKGPGIFKDCKELKGIPPVLEKIPVHTFLRCGLEKLDIFGEVFLDAEALKNTNINLLFCEKLEGVDGDYSIFENILVSSPSLTETIEQLFYNGYPVAFLSPIEPVVL